MTCRHWKISARKHVSDLKISFFSGQSSSFGLRECSADSDKLIDRLFEQVSSFPNLKRFATGELQEAPTAFQRRRFPKRDPAPSGFGPANRIALSEIIKSKASDTLEVLTLESTNEGPGITRLFEKNTFPRLTVVDFSRLRSQFDVDLCLALSKATKSLVRVSINIEVRRMPTARPAISAIVGANPGLERVSLWLGAVCPDIFGERVGHSVESFRLLPDLCKRHFPSAKSPRLFRVRDSTVSVFCFLSSLTDTPNWPMVRSIMTDLKGVLDVIERAHILSVAASLWTPEDISDMKFADELVHEWRDANPTAAVLPLWLGRMTCSISFGFYAKFARGNKPQDKEHADVYLNRARDFLVGNLDLADIDSRDFLCLSFRDPGFWEAWKLVADSESVDLDSGRRVEALSMQFFRFSFQEIEVHYSVLSLLVCLIHKLVTHPKFDPDLRLPSGPEKGPLATWLLVLIVSIDDALASRPELPGSSGKTLLPEILVGLLRWHKTSASSLSPYFLCSNDAPVSFPAGRSLFEFFCRCFRGDPVVASQLVGYLQEIPELSDFTSRLVMAPGDFPPFPNPVLGLIQAFPAPAPQQ